MILLAFALLFLGQVIGVPIVGGQSSYIQLHPWLVSIQKNGYHHCAGSIISKSTILTAAHCTDNHSPDSFIVRAGSSRTDSGGLWHRVVAIRQHKNYEEFDGFPKFWNDLALIKVSPPFNFGSDLSPIQLASKRYTIPSNTLVNIAGWGSILDRGFPIYQVKSTSLRIVDSVDCAKMYEKETGRQMRPHNQICTSQSGGDACLGDSGGPLVDKNFIQVGVISWGLGCADFHFPRVHQNISHYRDWIDKNSYFLESSTGLANN